MPPMANAREMYELLTVDLRIDESELRKLNIEKVEMLLEYYHTTNIKRLCTVLRRIQ